MHFLVEISCVAGSQRNSGLFWIQTGHMVSGREIGLLRHLILQMWQAHSRYRTLITGVSSLCNSSISDLYLAGSQCISHIHAFNGRPPARRAFSACHCSLGTAWEIVGDTELHTPFKISLIQICI